MKLFWFIIVIVILGIAGIGYLYFTYEKPKQIQEENEIVNITIYALYNSSYITTNYNLYVIKDMTIQLYKTSQTVDGISLIGVPRASNIILYNFNTDNQVFYTTEINKFVNGTERFELNLVEPGDLTYEYSRDGDILYLNLSSEGKYQDIHFCDKWSVHIITLRHNYTEIDSPAQYSDYHACYDTGITLDNSTSTLEFNMKYFGDVGKDDFINLALYDADCYMGVCKSFESDRDLGAPNVEISLTNIS